MSKTFPRGRHIHLYCKNRTRETKEDIEVFQIESYNRQSTNLKTRIKQWVDNKDGANYGREPPMSRRVPYYQGENEFMISGRVIANKTKNTQHINVIKTIESYGELNLFGCIFLC